MDIEIKVKFLDNGNLKIQLDDKRPSYWEDWNRELTIDDFIKDLQKYIIDTRPK